VFPRPARAPFAITEGPITVPARSARSVEVAFEPLEPGLASAMLFLETDDPDESLVVVRLSGNGTSSAFADAGVGGDGGVGPSTAGGCGCRAAGDGSSRGALALAGIVTLALAARRRRTLA
jgi:MYXO-CTERM domain-containing protein